MAGHLTLIPPKSVLNENFAKSHLPIAFILFSKSFWKFYTELNIMNAVFSAKCHKDLLYQKAMQKPDFQFKIDFKMACLTLKLLLWTEFYKSLF